MAVWPAALPSPSLGMSEEIYLPQLKSEFEANYIQSRPRATREIRRWNLKWNAMSESNYQTLETFFIANQGSSFTWPHPVTATNYSVRFSDDNIKSSFNNSPGYRAVEVNIEEV